MKSTNSPFDRSEAGADRVTGLSTWSFLAQHEGGKLSATFDTKGTEMVRQAMEALVANIKDGTKPPQHVVLLKPELITKAP